MIRCAASREDNPQSEDFRRSRTPSTDTVCQEESCRSSVDTTSTALSTLRGRLPSISENIPMRHITFTLCQELQPPSSSKWQRMCRHETFGIRGIWIL